MRVVLMAVAGLLVLSANVSHSFALPSVSPVTTSKAAVERVACVGNIRTYRNFTHCKSFARNSVKYCNKICS